MALVDSLVVFLVGLLIGGLAIYIGARLIVDSADYSHAVITALIGAIIYGIVSFLIGGLPVIGPLLALVAWIAVINWRYHGGWVNAALIGLIAWLSVIIVLSILASFDLTTFDAIGVPLEGV